jgi:hypothetical protein
MEVNRKSSYYLLLLPTGFQAFLSHNLYKFLVFSFQLK